MGRDARPRTVERAGGAVGGRREDGADLSFLHAPLVPARPDPAVRAFRFHLAGDHGDADVRGLSHPRPDVVHYRLPEPALSGTPACTTGRTPCSRPSALQLMSPSSRR